MDEPFYVLTEDGEKLYLPTDDRLDVGDKPLEYTTPEEKAFHDWLMKNRKEILQQLYEGKVPSLGEWDHVEK